MTAPEARARELLAAEYRADGLFSDSVIKHLLDGEAVALRALTKALAHTDGEAKTWRPIDTAPRDGSWFVIVSADGDYEVGCYDPSVWNSYEEVEGGLYRKVPTVTYEWRGFNNFGRAVAWTPIAPLKANQPDEGRGS